MLFSVVIPTYNRIDFLREALESVWAQRFKDYEVIVADDGSTDATIDYLKSLGSRVLVLTQPNKGPGAARNLAVMRARGDYIAFLDSDDLWFPWTLATYAKAFQMHPEAQLLGGCAIQFSRRIELLQMEDVLRDTLFGCLFAASPSGDLSLPTPAVAIRRESFRKTGGFRELYIGEDMDLWLRAGCLSGFVRIESPPVCAERSHNERVTCALSPALKGIMFALGEEALGNYPGGQEYAAVRRARLARAARSISVACLNHGLLVPAFRLYWRTLLYNIGLRRWRYIAGFPLRVAASAWKRQAEEN